MVAKDFFVITAPSGSGKTTLMHRVMEDLPRLEFSVSATTRPKRDYEQEGRDYYFLSVDEFTEHIDQDAFVEWEQVYPQKYYGTLKSEIKRISDTGNTAILDIDVLGALEIKKQYTDRVVAVFIAPPSKAQLEERLKARGTESAATLKERLDRYDFEMQHQDDFDYVVVNDDLETATSQLKKIFSRYS